MRYEEAQPAPFAAGDLKRAASCWRVGSPTHGRPVRSGDPRLRGHTSIVDANPFTCPMKSWVPACCQRISVRHLEVCNMRTDS